MDSIFNILASFLAVHPVQTGQQNALYRAWSYMRTFANIAFVIAFLIIIYSQLTSYGVSNYGIKKLLPRIIIAALLVNLSYIICSLAIDISNVLGYSIQNIFIGMRNTLVGTEGNSWDIISWSSVGSFILSGGALATVGGIAAFSTVATYGILGSLALFLPALVTFLVAVLVALVIMASRQALITILTILAPLAFVAYLLPNTEKWFDKWRSTFMTMLILFPAFSVIFGGSQLAGVVIIQNADSINLIILGMIVQVAPLFVTPLLFKFSGSLLGRIAGIVNDPNRGMIDRTRNFAKDRAENIKARRLGTPSRPGVLGAAQRAGQRLDHNRRRREGWRNAHTAMSDGNWANSQDFKSIDHANRAAADHKSLGETLSATAYNQSKLANATIRQLDVDVRQAKLNLENAELKATNDNWEKNHAAPIVSSKLQQRVLKDTQAALHAVEESEYGEFKTGEKLNAPRTINNLRLQQEAMRNADLLSANALRKAAAERVLTDQFTKKLEDNTEMIDGKALQAYSGGIDPNGAQRALASATSARSRAFNENVDNAGAILSSKNISDFDSVDIALGKEAAGIQSTYEMQIAAIRKITKSGNAGAIAKFLENFDVNGSDITQDMRQEVADNLISNSARPKWYGAGTLAKIKSGDALFPGPGPDRADSLILAAYTEGKLSSADTLVSQDKDHIVQLATTFKRRKADFTSDPTQLAKFKEHLTLALRDPRFSGRAGERTKYLQEIYDDLP
jgi:hypothetical protein